MFALFPPTDKADLLVAVKSAITARLISENLCQSSIQGAIHCVAARRDGELVPEQARCGVLFLTEAPSPVNFPLPTLQVPVKELCIGRSSIYMHMLAVTLPQKPHHRPCRDASC